MFRNAGRTPSVFGPTWIELFFLGIIDYVFTQAK